MFDIDFLSKVERVISFTLYFFKKSSLIFFTSFSSKRSILFKTTISSFFNKSLL